MCIVIDINTLSAVFQTDSSNHKDFKPVYDWICIGKGKLVFGGTKYLKELGETYRGLFLQYRKAGKAKLVDQDKVDTEEKLASVLINHKNFDDQHIVGLLKASGCMLVCSLDTRAFPFFTHSSFFSPASRKPKIYSSKANEKLLVDKNIADFCKPCSVGTKDQRKIMQTPIFVKKKKRSFKKK